MAKTNSLYRISPAGIAKYPWVNSPDTKFNADGVFKNDLIVGAEDAQKFKGEIDAAVDAAFEEGTKDLSPAEQKKWSRFYPYEVEENDDGTPTGRVIFKFRQNATLRVEGEEKKIHIAIFDSKDQPTAAKVRGGSTIRHSYKLRPIKMATSKQWGVRLDFLKVQILKLAEFGGDGSGGFGSVEGGYVEEHFEAGADSPSPAVSSGSADY